MLFVVRWQHWQRTETSTCGFLRINAAPLESHLDNTSASLVLKIIRVIVNYYFSFRSRLQFGISIGTLLNGVVSPSSDRCYDFVNDYFVDGWSARAALTRTDLYERNCVFNGFETYRQESCELVRDVTQTQADSRRTYERIQSFFLRYWTAQLPAVWNVRKVPILNCRSHYDLWA